MLSITIIVFILIGLIVHRHLTAFWEQGMLPYSMGFLLFANSFALIYLVSFIWMFGIIGGIVVALLCYLQVVYCAGLWVFLLPVLISWQKSLDNFTIPKVNPLVCGRFSFLVIIVAILTVINFFASPYKSMWELMGENVWTHILIFIGILVIGNVGRVAVLPKFTKKAVENNLPSTQSEIKPPTFYKEKLKETKKRGKYGWMWILFGLLCVYFIGMLVVTKDIKSSKLKLIERQTVMVHKQPTERLEEGYPQKHFLSDKQMKIPLHYIVLGEMAELSACIVFHLPKVTIFTTIGIIPFLYFKRTRHWQMPVYILFAVSGWFYGISIAGLFYLYFYKMNITSPRIFAFGILFLHLAIFTSTPVVIFKFIKKNNWKHFLWLIFLITYIYVGMKVCDFIE